MNPELYLVFLPAVSWLLFSLGGTQISGEIKGQKWIRRYLLPAVYFAACLFAGIMFLKALLVMILSVIAFCLPYGDRTSYPEKFLVGCCYGAISVPIGLSWWNLLTALGFILLFILSNTKLTEKIFVWKIVEGFFGALCGIQLGAAITKTLYF